MLFVKAAVLFYAERYGEDVGAWGLIGLLHDFGRKIHPSLERHPQNRVPILHEDIVQDILSHADHLGLSRDTIRRKAICACDEVEVTGLITAVALVRPSTIRP